MTTAYDVLREACGFSRSVPPNNSDMVTSALFLNWNRAKYIKTSSKLSDDEYWSLFFKVGFVASRVLPFADGGIRPIVQRIIEQGWLTDECCSGHAGEQKTNPYMGIVFPDEVVRKEFVSRCKEVFPEGMFELEITGDDFANDPYNEYREGFADSEQAFAWFNERRLSTFFWWTTVSDKETQEVWCTFSRVLNQYDRKGLYYPLLSSLRLYDISDEGSRMLNRVYTRLCYR